MLISSKRQRDNCRIFFFWCYKARGIYVSMVNKWVKQTEIENFWDIALFHLESNSTYFNISNRVDTLEAYIQLAIWASCKLHALAQESYQLALNFCFHDWLWFFCNLNSSENLIICPSGKLTTEFTSPIAISTSQEVSDMPFNPCWKYKMLKSVEFCGARSKSSNTIIKWI